MICERLRAGHLTAIDRSPRMIAAATRRCARHIAAGCAEFLLGAFETLDLAPSRFDVILAVGVRLFHVDPEGAGALAERWLDPEGRLITHYDAPD